MHFPNTRVVVSTVFRHVIVYHRPQNRGINGSVVTDFFQLGQRISFDPALFVCKLNVFRRFFFTEEK